MGVFRPSFSTVTWAVSPLMVKAFSSPPPAGMSVLTPLSGFTNPESNGTIGNNGGNLGMFFAPTAQASATFTLSPLAVDWGTIALGIG